MNISDTPNDKWSKEEDLIMKAMGEERNTVTWAITLLGSAKLMCDYLVKQFPEPTGPKKVMYGMALCMMHYNFIGELIREEISVEDFKKGFMPNDDSAWESDEDFEKRTIIVVKNMYENFKNQGKI